MEIIKSGQLWKSRRSGRIFRILNVTDSFAECVGQFDTAPFTDMNTYGDWKTKRTIIDNYTLLN